MIIVAADVDFKLWYVAQQQQRSHDEPVTLVASHRNVSINMICPLCHRLFPYNDTKKHFMQCLQEVSIIMATFS